MKVRKTVFTPKDKEVNKFGVVEHVGISTEPRKIDFVKAKKFTDLL